MRRLAAITLGIATAGVFFSCSNDSIIERDSDNIGRSSMEKPVPEQLLWCLLL
jgi:1-phosphatidylinositol phosphodiesterase